MATVSLPLLLALVLARASAALPANAPRVILFQLADDFGWSNFGLHGITNYTHNLDALAREGIILDRHYVFKYCSPSRCALQTGRNPIHVNVLNTPTTQHNAADPESGQQGAPVHMKGLAQKLAGAGYATHAYGKWNAGMARAEQTPGGRGYQHALVYFDYDEYFWNETTTARCGRQPMTDLYTASGPATRGVNASFTCSQTNQSGCIYSDDVFADAAVAAIAEAGRTGAPLFLFWAPHAPHDPYECPASKLAQFPGIAQQPRHYYTAMCSVLDDNSGRVRDALHAAGLWNSTLWVFSSDNGGPTGAGYGGNNWPLKGGKASNLEGGVRVNAFATGGWLPEAVRGTTVSEGLVGVEDWYTTFCSLAGVDPTDETAAAAGLPPVDGLDVSPLLLAPGAASPRGEVILGTSLNGKITANGAASVQGVLRADGWKLLIGELSGAFWQGPVYPNASGYPSAQQVCGDPALPAGAPGAGPGCLYNVFQDPTEQRDLAAQEPAIVAELRARITAHNATVFSPDRGEDDGAACAALAAGGFWGTFLS